VCLGASNVIFKNKKNVSCSAGPVSFAYVKHGAADYVIVLYVDPSTATSLQKAKSSVHKRAVAGHLVVRCCFFVFRGID